MAVVEKPAQVIGKRKRSSPSAVAATLQIVTGTYERVLHGFTAQIRTDDTEEQETVHFSDNFLYNAHASAIRCLAMSAASSSKRFLASGSSDERVNLYHLSTRAPPRSSSKQQKTITPLEPSRNKELGALLHHDAPVTALVFPNHSKLLSASLDNNIGITRSRDWTLLSTIHAPVPKAAGRPSGDTFAAHEAPSGINDLAVHPSARLALTVGIGEKCMRLWNLVTGKKAGVLVFEKSLLAQIGEGKYRGGEGKRILWRPDGEEFIIGFERGILVYSLDCKVKAIISVGPRQRVCQIRYLPDRSGIIAVSTEDGHIKFYDTTKVQMASGNAQTERDKVPSCVLLAQTRGLAPQAPSRIKDFEILTLGTVDEGSHELDEFLIVTASSDGTVRVWDISMSEMRQRDSGDLAEDRETAESNGKSEPPVKQIGTILGEYETGRRITCLAAFVMDDKGSEHTNGNQPDGHSANGPDITSSDDEGSNEEEEWEGIGDD